MKELQETPAENKAMPFTATNYKLMGVGIAILIVGFTVMSLDNDDFGFGFLGLTLGPIIVMVGFIFHYFAILKDKKQDDTL